MLKLTRPALAASALLAIGTAAGAASTVVVSPAEATVDAAPQLGASSESPADPAATPPAETTGTQPIECGGYDEDGNVVNEQAAATEEVPVRADGSYVVPYYCYGYSEDGVFIGDD